MGVTLTDVLLFGKAQSDDVDNATLVIYRRNILRWSALGGYLDIIVKGISPLSLPDAIADSLEYLKAFGGTEQRNLPTGYTQLEYIESTGTQYIDTGITATNNTGLKVVYEYTGAGSAAIAGIYQGVDPRTDTLFVTSNIGTTSSTLFCAQAGAALNVAVTIAFNTKYVCEINYMNSGYMGFDGDITTQIGTNGVYTDKTIPLFARYIVGGDNYAISNSKIYSAVFTEGNTISHNFIPCKDPNGVVGMYDTVTGNFLTNAGTGTFTAGGEAVPTPDAPMDIVSNNGVLKARHQSGLPLGYTELEYIYSPGNVARIDTGISGGSDSLRIDIKCYSESYTQYAAFFGNIVDEDTNTTRLIAGSSSNGVIADLNRKAGGTTINNSVKTTDLHEYSIYQNGNNQTVIEVDGTVVDTIDYIAGTTNTTNIALNAARVDTVTPAGATKYYYYMKIWNGNTLVRNMVPAKRNNDNKVGMYDVVSKQFFFSVGSDDFTAGATVSDPVEIYTDGTVETIEDTIGNTATAEMLLKVGDYQDEQEILSGAVTRKVGVKVLDGTEDWQSINTPYFSLAKSEITPSALSGDNFNSICSHFVRAQRGIELPTKVSFYWGISYLNINIDVSGSTTVAQFKQYLANQYAAGTPVIVIYPLATPTTESVTGQTLQVTDGDNVVEITQAGLDNLELEAKYQAAVSLTIQEVQDANLDPNVEVTIN